MALLSTDGAAAAACAALRLGCAAAMTAARKDVGREEVTEKARQAIEYAIGSNTISLADSFRVLGWARWAAVAGLDFVSMHPRDVDTWLTTVELKSSLDDDKSTRARAAFLRDCLENG